MQAWDWKVLDVSKFYLEHRDGSEGLVNRHLLLTPPSQPQGIASILVQSEPGRTLRGGSRS